MKKYFFIFLLLFFSVQMMQGQVLISLLLGNKLNSGKLVFGLDGGANFSNISNIDPSKYKSGFNIGFYFDILLKEKKNWYLHTGVIVKSPLGAKDLNIYSLNDPDLDSVFSTGSVDRKLKYYNVPILIKYQFKNRMFVELGPMLGLLARNSHDEFYADINSSKDLTYKRELVDEYNRIDVGVEAGIGYQFHANHGMYFAARYYQGLRNVTKEKPPNPQLNSSIYLVVGIPIGASERAKEKAKEKTKARTEKKAERQKEKKNKKTPDK